jgi:GTP-sensing pleiotropic transcriptional regulator CodY
MLLVGRIRLGTVVVSTVSQFLHDDMLLTYGAVLLRGVDISSASQFENAALSFQPPVSTIATVENRQENFRTGRPVCFLVQ